MPKVKFQPAGSDIKRAPLFDTYDEAEDWVVEHCANCMEDYPSRAAWDRHLRYAEYRVETVEIDDEE